MKLASIALLAALSAAATQTPRRLYQPEDVDRPLWLEGRKNAQLRSASSIGAFHDFRFVDRVEASGISFKNEVTEDSKRHYKAIHYDHGNGIAVADVDGDGALDVLFTNQTGPNALYRNVGGGKFEDITARAGIGLADRISVTGAFGDIDNDGDPDLFVTTVRNGNVLFENDGTGRFVDITESAGVGYSGHSSGSVFFDYDRDGLLDLFVSNVGLYTTDEVGPDGYYVGVLDAFAGHLRPERTESSIFYRNLGERRFEDVTEKVGLVDETWNGDASPADFNDDGWTDLYVLNMQGHDQYYENVGGERFERKSREVFRRTPWGTMGIGVFDWDNDGDFDMVLSDMHSDMSKEIGPELEKKKSAVHWDEDFLRSGGNSIYGNAFYRNDGGGRFTEISDAIGVENYWPWGLSVGDVNADGYEDVFLASGMNYLFRYGVNTMLLNDGGERFHDSEFILGIEPRRGGRLTGLSYTLDADGEDKDLALVEAYDLEGSVEVWGALGTRSSVFFDLDDDGDLDLVTNEFNDGPMVLMSDLSEKRDVHFLKVRLQGTTSNRSGIMAKVVVTAGEDRYTKTFDGKTGYLSQSDLPLYFGLDGHTVVDRIDVRWPSGASQSLPGPVEINRLVVIEESP